MKLGMKIKMLHTKNEYYVSELGVQILKNINKNELVCGEVG
jgi:translation elongation factor EF-4